MTQVLEPIGFDTGKVRRLSRRLYSPHHAPVGTNKQCHGISVTANAVMESFYGTLKVEQVYKRSYQTRSDARADIFDYIKRFYNRWRRHSSLGYVSPKAFEAAMHTTNENGDVQSVS